MSAEGNKALILRERSVFLLKTHSVSHTDFLIDGFLSLHVVSTFHPDDALELRYTVRPPAAGGAEPRNRAFPEGRFMEDLC